MDKLVLPLRYRIYVSAAALLAVVASSLSFTLYSNQRMEHVLHVTLDNRLGGMDAARAVKQTLTTYDNNLFRYLATLDEIHLKDQEDLEKAMELELNRLGELSRSQVLRTRLVYLQDSIRRYFSDAHRVLKFFESTALPEDAGFFQSVGWLRGQEANRKELGLLTTKGQNRLVRVFALCDEIITLNHAELERAQSELNILILDTGKRAWMTLMATAVLVILISSALVFWLLSPLKKLMVGIEHLEKGDYSFEVEQNGKDEIGLLTRAFNRMTRTIREQHHKLLNETITDELTGAFNQRHFRTALWQEIERSKRSQRPLCLLMMDLDNFKKINDSYGHELGNEVLKRVVSTIRKELRSVDILARYGGDEIAVILPDTDANHGRSVAERGLRSLSQCSPPARAEALDIQVTLSIGGACYPREASGVEVLLEKADSALYQAKHAGRNRLTWIENLAIRASKF